jgi:pyruvate,water dikinase
VTIGKVGLGVIEPLLNLDDITPGHELVAGAKAAALAALRIAGEPVPEGAVIPASVPVDQAAAAVGARFGGKAVAVRSSSTAEDTTRASYAGQYLTVLNVDADQVATVAEAIRSVRASAIGPGATGYADRPPSPMPVLVMPMVDAEAAGVAFTANPLTGDPEVVVEAVPGLADVLVSGSATPERWVARDGDQPSLDHVGTIEVLTPQQVNEVIQLARRVAERQRVPQDVEWAWADGRVHLLQARPITALPVPAPIDVPPQETWIRADGPFSQPLKPLEASIWFPRLEESGRKVFAEAGAPIETMRHRLIGGWTYTRVVPPMDQGNDGAAAPPALLFGLALHLVPALRRRLKTATRVWRSDLGERLIGEWESGGRDAMRTRTRTLRDTDRATMSDAQLAAHLVALRDHLQTASDVHLRLPVIATFLSMGRLGVLVERLLGWDPDRAFDLVQGFAEASTTAGQDFDQLAAAIADDRTAHQLLADDPLALVGHPGPGGQALRNFLDAHGHQIVGFDLAHPTWAEDPRLLLGMVRARLQVGGGDRRDPREAAEAAAAEARSDLRGRARDLTEFEDALVAARRGRPFGDDTEIDVLQVMGVVRYVALEAGERLMRRGAIQRPDDVFYLTDEELERGLADGRVEVDIERRRAEVRWAEAHPGPQRYGPEPQPFPSLRFAPARARPFLEAMVWAMDRLAAPPVEQSGGGGELRGLAASPGVVTATARLIAGPAEFDRLQAGDVMVCRSTIAAWSVVFPLVSAVVTEVGGPLSHPAILAREFGIPAVVGVPDAMERIRDGWTVTVDGASGFVRLGD